jgi:hypothetical protein
MADFGLAPVELLVLLHEVQTSVGFSVGPIARPMNCTMAVPWSSAIFADCATFFSLLHTVQAARSPDKTSIMAVQN